MTCPGGISDTRDGKRSVRLCHEALRLLRSHEGVPPLIQATERFAEQVGVAVETISGHLAPYLHRPTPSPRSCGSSRESLSDG
jgi:hypothetical protein